MALDEVAARLYGLPPEEFIAARSAAQKQARADGHRDVAAEIGRLAKPTVVAWLANQLVRRHPDELAMFLELGAGLREATATLEGEQLRALSRQQHQVINALIGQARDIGRAAGHELNDAAARGLEDTLRAALADGELADQLAQGQLSKALEHVGFSGLGGAADDPKPAKAKATRAEPATGSDAESARRKAAEREAAEREAKEREAAEREARRVALEAAEADVAAAERVLVDAEAEQKRAEQAAEHARQAVTEARSRVAEAQARRDAI